jgi:hypothetical protein
MPVLETALLRVGTGVTTAVCQGWLRKRSGGRFDAAALAGLINSNWTTELDRRKARRNLERMSEQVVDQLRPYLQVEFGAVPESEIAAACSAAADTIESADVGLDEFLAVNMDPTRLRILLEQKGKSGDKRRFLALSAQPIFEAILREATTYIVEIKTSLPEFSTLAAKEMLDRESELIELVQTVLNQIPQLSIAGYVDQSEQIFETEYRREVARRLDSMELFGLQLSPIRRRYVLSVAYITLAFAARNESSISAEASETHEPEDSRPLPVDEALKQSERILIRGEAGSGKTTLLQWLAVNAARESLSGSLSGFVGLVPLYVRLRQFVGKSLPSPEDMISGTAPNSSGQMPQGWVQSKLPAGAL